jgi:hypothetical protein
MIKNFDELVQAILECTRHIPEGTHEEIVAWADADAQVQNVRRLLDVYRQAESNPPDGVIGVGIITYAEYKLQEAQQDG